VLALGESAVVAAVSAPHRPEAFEAARYAIDALKAAAPIWKHETWADGAGWGTDAVPIDAVDSIS
jgi:molybdopterin synthase catalytic subunit